ncbi:putative receptor-like protein kinase At3g47110 isoform X2 [Hordeum vulgare subsp. vulgare]|uniref:Receptor kinase-like protein Xa21 n=2 Tax=Hordeum vulgare subsp. vulgare TaxID=112509 RepID=A0A8I6WT88_HORVV|nr:putative receptor-like protein kinase At3g47110 isoform X2 [Hordeum vulgare subsp. vulgare]
MRTLSMVILLAFLLTLCYEAGNIHCSAVSHGNRTDMLALLEFKGATNDPTGALRSWDRRVHYCNWTGVACSQENPWRVGGLFLGGESLSGEITPSLGNLTYLQVLNLSSNGFSGQLPSLNQLHELLILDLSSNSFHGIIPDSITNCSNLKAMDLSRNMLEGPIPTKIGSLYNLLDIDLSRNNLTGVIPPTISNATQLLVINLRDNQLGGIIPAELGRLSNIRYLIFGGNRLSGPIPPSIFNLTSLTVLDGYLNMLEMALPLDIGDTLPNLKSLTLGGSMLNGHIPASLGNATKLRVMDLSQNSLVGEIPTFGKLQSLNKLNLEYNKLESGDAQSWESLYGLTNCSSLSLLSLDNNQLQGDIPVSVGKLSAELTSLQLNGNNLSGTVPLSLRNLSSLINLNLSENSLTGTIEGWLGSLTKLQSLDLHGNNFVGSIPPSFGNLTGLTFLFLAKNEFEGPIPPILGKLSQLSRLDLSYNNLQGDIPPEISELKQLIELYLSSSRLSGTIPDNLGQCQGLITIQMDHNNLTGGIPTSFGNLLSLNTLNLSNNNLSGTIPVVLSDLQLLSKLDLSSNRLQGAIPRNGVFEHTAAVSLDGNWELCGGATDFHVPSCPDASLRTGRHYTFIRVLIPIIGFLSLALLTWFIIHEKIPQAPFPLLPSLGEKFPRVSYWDLARATGNFSEINLIGEGSYSSVYKGKLKQVKREVAVKVLDLEIPGAEGSFALECKALRGLRHRNIVPLITECSAIDNKGNAFRALIYAFMPNGNLDTWLHHPGNQAAGRHLGLAQRISIATNIANALDYLHNDSGKPIAHCDLKPSNILLDIHMNACLGDFGIARFYVDSKLRTVGDSNSITANGTLGYMAPEYAESGHASTCGDVYSFGIVLLEMLTGKRPTDDMFRNELTIVRFVETNFPDHTLNFLDSRLINECNGAVDQVAAGTENQLIFQSLFSLLRVALLCTCRSPTERLNMREVATQMRKINKVNTGGRVPSSTSFKRLVSWASQRS